MEFLEDIFSYQYLTNAIIACVLSGITCGIIGTYIVARRTVFLAGGITHASFGGLGIAFYLGINPIWGAMLFAVASSLGIEYVNNKAIIREDSAIGIIWGIGMAIGAFFMSLRPGYYSGDLSSYLFGSIISVTDNDVNMLLIVTSVIALGALLWLRPIMYVAFDRNFARSTGIHTNIISYILSIVSAIAIVTSIRIMGIVLLVSLLTMPVVIANLFTKNYKHITIAASCLGVICSLLGIMLSYYVEVPSGPAIIFILTTCLLLGYGCSKGMIRKLK